MPHSQFFRRWDLSFTLLYFLRNKQNSTSPEVKWKSLSHVRLFSSPCRPWNFLGQNTGGGSLLLPTQGSNPHLIPKVSCIVGGFFTSWTTRDPTRYSINVCWIYTNNRIYDPIQLWEPSALILIWLLNISSPSLCLGTGHWMIIQSHAQVFPTFNYCLDYTMMNMLCNP